ncbi:MAG: hypothetical protein N838_11615 [Thiohalocapsa sp. PB-PSB1]|jgi:hypothetical protein|nr:MAG: hypothetical protein N838_11615 [Thiohalocapsa sp. PB-PSB1]
MTENVSQSQLALNAMYRASQVAIARAAEKNLNIPIWQNGKIVFINAKEELLTKGSTRPHTAPAS